MKRFQLGLVGALERARDGVPFREAYRRAWKQPPPGARVETCASLSARIEAGYGHPGALHARLEKL